MGQHTGVIGDDTSPTIPVLYLGSHEGAIVFHRVDELGLVVHGVRESFHVPQGKPPCVSFCCEASVFIHIVHALGLHRSLEGVKVGSVLSTEERVPKELLSR